MAAVHSPDVTAGRRPLWAELRDAIRGTGADYTKIPLKRAVFLLAVPMVLELVLESTFAVVDIYFVGKLGSSAVATVGLTKTFVLKQKYKGCVLNGWYEFKNDVTGDQVRGTDLTCKQAGINVTFKGYTGGGNPGNGGLLIGTDAMTRQRNAAEKARVNEKQTL